MLSVAEIMTPQPYTLSPDHTLQDAAKLMHEHHIRHIPIVSSDGNIVGVVSHRDVLAAGASRRVQGATELVGEESALALRSVMSTPVQTIPSDAELRGVASLLKTQRLGCLPVIEDGRMIGIVSDTDFLEVAITLMEQLEMSEPEEEF